MREAWGDVPLTIVRGRVDSEHLLRIGSVAADGRAAIGIIGRIDWVDNRPGVPREAQQVVIVDLATQHRQLIRTLPSATHSMGETAADERWFVWAERSSNALLSDWALFAYDRGTARLHEVARAPRLLDGRPLDSYVWLNLDRGVLVWAERVVPGAAGAEPAGPGRVMLMRLPDGPAEEIARFHGGGPMISWPYLAWGERKGERTTIVRHHLETGQREPVRGADDVSGAAIAGTATAWIDRRTGGLWLSETPQAEPRLLAEPDQRDSPFQEPVMSDRFVGWFSNTYPGVYDRQSHRVVLVDEVGTRAGWRVKTNRTTLSWAMRPPTDTPFLRTAVRDFAILDVSRIPSRP
ncbi:MAG: hypothetical protein ACRDM0_07975 [Thermoleophilaceae bacterium]